MLLLGSGFIALGFVQGFAQFIAVFLVMAIGSSLSGFMSLMAIIVNWFVRRRSRAMTMVGLGMSIGALLVPILAALMVEFGWRPISIGSGVLYLLVALPLGRLMTSATRSRSGFARTATRRPTPLRPPQRPPAPRSRPTASTLVARFAARSSFSSPSGTATRWPSSSSSRLRQPKAGPWPRTLWRLTSFTTSTTTSGDNDSPMISNQSCAVSGTVRRARCSTGR